MKKRHVMSLLSFLLLAVAAAATLWLLFPQTPRFTEKQCNLLKPGMTEEEVIAILGCPPEDYTSAERTYVFFISDCTVDGIKWNHSNKCWCGDHGAIGLEMRSDGTLQCADWYLCLNPPPTFSERIKGWLSFGKSNPP